MINLRKITEENFVDAFNLSLGKALKAKLSEKDFNSQEMKTRTK